MNFVYILYNEVINKFYIGATSNLPNRIAEHNKTGNLKYTRKQNGIWKLVYKESYDTKGLAMKREKEIKSWKSKKMIFKLIENQFDKSAYRAVPT